MQEMRIEFAVCIAQFGISDELNKLVCLLKFFYLTLVLLLRTLVLVGTT
jgi:hypothetical protein